MAQLSLTIESLRGEPQAVAAAIGNLVIAGWTARDAAAMEAHIKELEALGVARPKRTPIFYRVAAALLTTDDRLQVIGGDSSGEVEFVLLSLPQGLFVGVGSDHTDRKAEAVGVTLSKQMCAKAIGPRVWPFAEVAPHWDRLHLRSWCADGGARRPYQDGPVTRMRDPRELMDLYLGKGRTLPVGWGMYCGTLPAHGPIGGAARFEVELSDPVLGRALSHAYAIECLPIEG
ncbi:MAG: DUF2848 domain-containing protein [Alphaproteobacteria bacterium]|nr:DUF2848 domain-containing protein [Alphaproteobacteria bacterium]